MPKFRKPAIHRLAPAVLFMLCLVGCAKVGEPRPPLILIPEHTTQLTGLQRGEQVVLTWPPPARNTNGTPVSTLQRIDVYRLVEARTYQPSPLNAEAFARRAQKIRSIPAEEVGKWMKDGKVSVTDDLPLVDRSLLFQRSFRYAVTFVNDRKKSDGFSNFFFISPIPIPLSPDLNHPSYTEEAIELTWPAPEKNVDGSRPPKVVGYNVFRRESPEGPIGPPLNSAPITETRYQDRSFEFDKTYYYTVSVIASGEAPYAESLPSKPQAATPRDTFPPKPPADITTFPAAGEIRLVWAANTESDLAGYSILRAEKTGGPYRKLNAALLPAPNFKDTDVQSGRRYFYVITASDRKSNESRYSEEVSETAG